MKKETITPTERSRIWRQENADKYNSYHRKYRQKTKEHHEKAIQYSKDWFTNKQEELLALPPKVLRTKRAECVRYRIFRKANAILKEHNMEFLGDK